MRRIACFKLYWLLFILFSQHVLAQSAYKQNSLSLDPYLGFLTDSAMNLVADSMLSSSNQACFTSQNILSEQFRTWVKIRVPKDIPPGDYCVYSLIEDEIRLYIIRPDKIVSEKNGRYMLPAERSVPEKFRYICFTLNESDSVVFLRIDPIDGGPVPFTLTINQEEVVMSAIESNTRITLFISGALLVIIFSSFTL